MVLFACLGESCARGKVTKVWDKGGGVVVQFYGNKKQDPLGPSLPCWYDDETADEYAFYYGAQRNVNESPVCINLEVADVFAEVTLEPDLTVAVATLRKHFPDEIA